MKQKYTYGECYRILNIKPGCNWSELRKAYKVQIQKWHPDRFKEGSSKKYAAEEKIKDINTAYQQLLTYYKKHNSLPDAEKPRPLTTPKKTAATTTEKKQTTTKIKKTTPRKSSPYKEKKKKPYFSIIIVASILVYAYIELSPENKTTTQSQTTVKKYKVEKENKKNISKSTRLEKKDKTNRKKKSDSIIYSKNNKFFTYGSTIGEVISVQGTPTRIDGDIWYYGKSEIYFNNGAVVRWKRAQGSPLKAGLSLPNPKKK